MPITDAILAYQSQAPSSVVYKHIVTVDYLIITFIILKLIVKKQNE